MRTISLTSSIVFLLILFSEITEAQTVTDIDGNIYQIVTIGTQVWMKENLKSIHYSDNSDINKVWTYNNSDSLLSIYGRLYSWESAMKGAVSSDKIPSGVQGVCPVGWHLPSNAEWDILTEYCGGMFEAGAKLKEAGYAHWLSPNTGATNSSGFTGLPGGTSGETGGTILGETGFFWTTFNENDYIYAFILGNQVPYAIQVGTLTLPGSEKSGYSVRCLRNTPATPINIIQKAEEFRIYPNPAKDRITVEIESNIKIDLSIYGIDGKLIMYEPLLLKETVIDISTIPDGVYTVFLRNAQGILQKRLVKTSLIQY